MVTGSLEFILPHIVVFLVSHPGWRGLTLPYGPELWDVAEDHLEPLALIRAVFQEASALPGGSVAAFE